jgi:hypothetical protein
MFLPESISHHSYGLHGSLEISILWLHTHYAIIIIYVFVWVFEPSGLVLLLNLSLRVKNDVKVLGLLDLEA